MICKNIIECFSKNGACKYMVKDCANMITNSLIVCKENNSSYILSNFNNEKVLKIHIDGKAIDDKDELRCDYAIVYHRQQYEVIFIELKGHNFYHALEQIMNMVNIYFSMFFKINGRIICSSGTRFNMASSEAIKLKRLLFKKGGSLIVSNRELHENLARF